MRSLLWMIPAFPLGKRGRAGAIRVAAFAPNCAWLGTASIGSSALVAILLAASFLSSPPSENHWTQHLWTWISVGDFQPEIGFYFDPVTLVMVLRDHLRRLSHSSVLSRIHA